MSGQSYQPLGRGWQSLNDRLEQANPDWKLDEKRPQAADRVDAVRLIDLHRPTREFLSVVLVLFLQLLELRLELGHLQHLSALAHSERYEHNTHNQREEDDSDAEVQEGHAIQQNQAIYHRLDDSQVPNVDEYL